jgi:predicted nucleotidyltransferase
MYLNKLFDKYVELKILRYLLGHPREKVTVNALARKVGVSSGSVSVFLKNIEKDFLVKKSRIGNSLVYELNNEHYLIKNLKLLHSLLFLGECVVEEVSKVDETLISLVLYGSYATGRFDERSDVDLLVITAQKGKLHNLISKLEDRLDKRVTLERFTLAEWKRTKTKNRPFYDSVKQNHVLLYGSGLP